ncbi:MAG: peptidylprolyl isomerase [Bacteroidales bacterium]|nr:peptidylprolyl isomerase [Bacteroidales bacterium]
MRIISLTSVFVFLSLTLFSQKNETLLTVGNKKISANEFLYIYKKNNSDNINKESVDDYLNLFTNFKLKVTEAENLKMDTSATFKKELSGYTDQLAKPYLTENIKWKELTDEALKRNKKELKLDIIFIKLPQDATPEDTLKAFKKALKIRERLINGENFDSVAVATSDDRAVKKNKGHLSYLKPLRIPYNIQNFAFNAKKGDLSMPIKTDFGYYLIRLADIRPAKGFVKVAHIMIAENGRLPDSVKAEKKNKIDSIYTRLQAGDKFEDLAKLSDDKASAKKGGELPEFSTGRMVPEFEKAAFALQKPGDYSKPIKTRFGWHIIKLISTRPPDNIEKQRTKIKKTVENDEERKEIVRKFVIKKLKKDYNFKQLKSPDIILGLLDSTIYEGKWKMPVTKKPDFTLFTVNNKNYSDRDFAHFIEKNQKRNKKTDFKTLLNKYYNDFVYKILSQTEISNLKTTKPEFAYLLKEYHDGMLLFDLMKEKIWDKASEDTLGLKKYYNDNYDKLYSKQIKYNISVFKYQTAKDAKKALKLLRKSRNKYNDSLLVKKISKGDTLRFTKVDGGEYSKGENIYADKIFSSKNTNTQKIFNFPEDKLIIVINSEKIFKGKPFDEMRGVVISDYQNFLEKNWLKELRKKYPVTINQSVLTKIKSSLK